MRLVFVWAAISGMVTGLVIFTYPRTQLLVLFGLSLLVAWRWRLGLVVVVMAVGMWWRVGTWQSSTLQSWQPQLGKQQAWQGIVVESTSYRSVIGEIRPKQYGNLEIRSRQLPAGALVSVTCRPGSRSDHIKRDLVRRVIVSCDQAQTKILNLKPHRFRSWLARIRAHSTATLQHSLRSDPGALAIGLLFGDDDYFSDELREAFRRTGTTHLVALSGYNVSILLTVTLETLASWIGRRRSTILSLLLLVAFIILTGAAASVLRAAIMAIAVHGARWLGRPVSPWRPLGYAVIGMLWQNPGLLLHDVGFQLSVLSTAGLMTFTQPLTKLLSWVPNVYTLRENLATTLGATLATLPLIVGLFARVSLVSVAVNAAVLPLMPLAMGLSFLVLGGGFHLVFGLLVRPAAEVLLHTITWLLHVGASVPWAAVATSPVLGWLLAVPILGTMSRLIYEQVSPAPQLRAPR